MLGGDGGDADLVAQGRRRPEEAAPPAPASGLSAPAAPVPPALDDVVRRCRAACPRSSLSRRTRTAAGRNRQDRAPSCPSPVDRIARHQPVAKLVAPAPAPPRSRCDGRALPPSQPGDCARLCSANIAAPARRPRARRPDSPRSWRSPARSRPAPCLHAEVVERRMPRPPVADLPRQRQRLLVPAIACAMSAWYQAIVPAPVSTRSRSAGASCPESSAASSQRRPSL